MIKLLISIMYIELYNYEIYIIFLKQFSTTFDILLYTINYRRVSLGYYATIYFTAQVEAVKKAFFRVRNSLENIGAEQMGFSFKLFQGKIVHKKLQIILTL